MKDTIRDPLDDIHIRVTLDFIPVKERLPEVDFEVYIARLSTLCSPREVCWYETKWQEYRDGEWFNVKHVTHWAEIPDIQGVR